MGAPEKIYVHVRQKPCEITFSEVVEKDVSNIEYIRTNAFINKACSSIDKLLSGYIIRNFHFGDSYEIDKLIEDFKNYMKGE